MRYIIIFFLIFLLSAPAKADSVEVMVDLDNNNSFTEQTGMGTFLSQAIKDVCGSDIAIVCSSSIKGGLGRGSFDSSVFSDLLYYPDDKVVILELTGKQIKDIMERSIKNYPGENSCFLQVAGLNGTFFSGASEGKISELYIGGTPVNDNTGYRVAVDETLAGGFSGYITFTEGKILRPTNLTLKEIINAYLKKSNVIDSLDNAGLKPI